MQDGCCIKLFEMYVIKQFDLKGEERKGRQIRACLGPIKGKCVPLVKRMDSDFDHWP